MNGRKFMPRNRENSEEAVRKNKKALTSMQKDSVLDESDIECNPITKLQNEMGNKAVQELIEHASSGTPIHTAMSPEGTAEMELRLGQSLQDINIHEDSAAREICEQSEAKALTFGKDIFVKEPVQYDRASQELLLHELAHIAQQPSNVDLPQRITKTEDPVENEAQNAAMELLRGHDINISKMPELATTMARIPDEEHGTESSGATSTLSDEMRIAVYNWEINVFHRLDQLILIMPRLEQEETIEEGSTVIYPAATAGEWVEFCDAVNSQLQELVSLIEELQKTPGISDLTKDLMENVKYLIKKAIKNCKFAGRQRAHRRLFKENMERALEWARTEDVFEITSAVIRSLMR